MKDKIEFITPYYESFRCNKIATTYDLEIGESRTRTIEYDVPPSENENWKIGVIVGSSGSGKTSVAKKHYGNVLYTSSLWNKEPVVENFDSSLSFEIITGTLTSVGFSSIPAWLQPYDTLSNGEKFRCDLARALLDVNNQLVVFDEYTSVVDRTVAKTASFALSKALVKNKTLSNKKFIAVTCHYDILEWINPDWILDMRTGSLLRGRLRRPKLIFRIYQVDRSLWSIFSQYHYLTSALNTSARCYCAYIEDKPTAFLATLHSMGHKGSRRVHRLVVLPEFQGVGLGTRLASTIAEYEIGALRASSFMLTTSNAFFARVLAKTSNWKITERNRTGKVHPGGKGKTSFETFKSGFGRIGRARISLKFIGNR